MTVFRYRLQALLDKKTAERNLAEAELAEAKKRQRAALEKLQEMEKASEKLTGQIAGARQQLLIESEAGAIELGRLTNYLRGLVEDEKSARRAADLQRRVVEGAEDGVRKAQAWLVEASRGTEILEKHREKLKKSFLRASLRKEEIDQDEVAALLHSKPGEAYEN